jgi:hypothetical protein
MVVKFLLPESTVVTDGRGPDVDLGIQPGSRRYLTLGITRITEHELLEVSVWGSSDGGNWDSRPLAKFPPKFHCGVYSIPLDLSTRLDVRFLRVEWKMSHWARGEGTPLCDFYTCVEERESRMTAAVA